MQLCIVYFLFFITLLPIYLYLLLSLTSYIVPHTFPFFFFDFFSPIISFLPLYIYACMYLCTYCSWNVRKCVSKAHPEFYGRGRALCKVLHAHPYSLKFTVFSILLHVYILWWFCDFQTCHALYHSFTFVWTSFLSLFTLHKKS